MDKKKLSSKILKEINTHPNWDEHFEYNEICYTIAYVGGIGQWMMHDDTNLGMVNSTDPESFHGLFPSRLDALYFVETGIGGKLERDWVQNDN